MFCACFWSPEGVHRRWCTDRSCSLGRTDLQFDVLGSSLDSDGGSRRSGGSGRSGRSGALRRGSGAFCGGSTQNHFSNTTQSIKRTGTRPDACLFVFSFSSVSQFSCQGPRAAVLRPLCGAPQALRRRSAGAPRRSAAPWTLRDSPRGSAGLRGALGHGSPCASDVADV